MRKCINLSPWRQLPFSWDCFWLAKYIASNKMCSSYHIYLAYCFVIYFHGQMTSHSHLLLSQDDLRPSPHLDWFTPADLLTRRRQLTKLIMGLWMKQKWSGNRSTMFKWKPQMKREEGTGLQYKLASSWWTRQVVWGIVHASKHHFVYGMLGNSMLDNLDFRHSGNNFRMKDDKSRWETSRLCFSDQSAIF